MAHLAEAVGACPELKWLKGTSVQNALTNVGVDADILFNVINEPKCDPTIDIANAVANILDVDTMRPIFGDIAICNVSDDQVIAIGTIVHEVMHALVRFIFATAAPPWKLKGLQLKLT